LLRATPPALGGACTEVAKALREWRRRNAPRHPWLAYYLRDCRSAALAIGVFQYGSATGLADDAFASF
jgi:hypothetical protein